MEFYRLWRIFVSNARVIVWLPLIATLAGLATAYVLPEQYASTALVLVRPAEQIRFDMNPGDRKELMEFPVSRSAPIDAPSKTYMEEIKSLAIAIRIVEALHLDVKIVKENRTRLETLRDDLKEWLVNTIRTTRNYFKYGRDIPVSPFDLAVENVQQKLDVAVRKDTYAFDINFQSSEPTEAAAVANMAAHIFIEHSAEAYRREAARTRDFIEAQLNESRVELETARAALLAYKNAGGTFDLASEYKEQLKDISELQSTRSKAEAKLAGLTRVFRPESPEVLAQRAEIAALTEQISRQQSPLAAYPQKETKLTAMSLAARLAEDRYEFFRKRFEEARIKEAASVAEIRIVSPALPSSYPVKPLKYIYAGLSFATALALALGWALVKEQWSPRVRVASDIGGIKGAAVLGSIPSIKPMAWSRS